jgi:hypothetical protein
MQCYEIEVISAFERDAAGRQQQLASISYWIPEEASRYLESILAPYDQHPDWYFDRLNGGRPPAPWAIACLPNEYALGGHVVHSRPQHAGIAFAPYATVSTPIPQAFVPNVGSLVLFSKAGLAASVGLSPLYDAAWFALERRDANRHWLVLLDALPDLWACEVAKNNDHLWRSSQG